MPYLLINQLIYFAHTQDIHHEYNEFLLISSTSLNFSRIMLCIASSMPVYWRHNDHDSVSNRQPYGCLLNRLFRRRSKKTSKFRVTGFCVGNSPGPVNSPHKGQVTRKMFPFDDVIMLDLYLLRNNHFGYILIEYHVQPPSPESHHGSNWHATKAYYPAYLAQVSLHIVFPIHI